MLKFVNLFSLLLLFSVQLIVSGDDKTDEGQWLILRNKDKDTEWIFFTNVPELFSLDQLYQHRLNGLVNQCVAVQEQSSSINRAWRWASSFIIGQQEPSLVEDTKEKVCSGIQNLFMLVKCGADSNIASEPGAVRLIHVMSGLGETKAIAFLLKHKADPTLCDIKGADAYRYAERSFASGDPERYSAIVSLLNSKDNKGKEEASDSLPG